MKTNSDNHAFPDPGVKGAYGLTKREYFAAMALQGLLSDTNNIASSAHVGGDDPEKGVQVLCKSAVQLADYLIEALNE